MSQRVLASSIALLLLAPACRDPARAPLVVSAAASLTEAFAEVEARFERQHRQVDLVLNTAGSAALVTQVAEGAPVDVVVLASPVLLDELLDTGRVAGAPVVIARNPIVLGVPAGNPAGVAGLDDLARPELLVGLCDEHVPCGFLAELALTAAGVTPSVDTRSSDVLALATLLTAGELDAGVVYATSARNNAIDVIDLHGAPEATYPAVALADGPNPSAARVLVDFLASPEGAAIMVASGFLSP